jgi:predicted NodU family carbamoyl transferase
MYFLGINWEIISGATLLTDDHIVASVSEERFTRNKKEISFPESAI